MSFKSNYMEVSLKTIDAVQHLKLQGFLKRSDILIRSEYIHNRDEQFGMFLVVVDSEGLMQLKEREDLFDKISVLGDETERWDVYNEEAADAAEDINMMKDFLFDFTIAEDEETGSLAGMLDVLNEMSLDLYKTHPGYREDYVVTDVMSYDEKIDDIDYLIGFFEGLERYEDCAFLFNLRKDIIKHHG